MAQLRPSSWLLIAVMAANVAVPAAYTARGALAGDAAPAGARAGAAAAAPAQAVPVRPEPVAGNPAPSGSAAHALPQPTPVSVRSSAPVCRAWGPFAAQRDAESTAARLGLAAGSFEILETREPRPEQFLVYVRVPGGRPEAQRVLGELTELGVESYLLERQAAASLLAVGVFGSLERARVLQGRLGGLGYDAVLAPRDRTRPAYHLLARLAATEQPAIPAAAQCRDIAPLQQFL